MWYLYVNVPAGEVSGPWPWTDSQPPREQGIELYSSEAAAIKAADAYGERFEKAWQENSRQIAENEKRLSDG